MVSSLIELVGSLQVLSMGNACHSKMAAMEARSNHRTLGAVPFTRGLMCGNRHLKAWENPSAGSVLRVNDLEVCLNDCAKMASS